MGLLCACTLPVDRCFVEEPKHPDDDAVRRGVQQRDVQLRELLPPAIGDRTKDSAGRTQRQICFTVRSWVRSRMAYHLRRSSRTKRLSVSTLSTLTTALLSMQSLEGVPLSQLHCASQCEGRGHFWGQSLGAASAPHPRRPGFGSAALSKGARLLYGYAMHADTPSDRDRTRRHLDWDQLKRERLRQVDESLQLRLQRVVLDHVLGTLHGEHDGKLPRTPTHPRRVCSARSVPDCVVIRGDRSSCAPAVVHGSGDGRAQLAALLPGEERKAMLLPRGGKLLDRSDECSQVLHVGLIRRLLKPLH
eukprot:7182881-Prymnesium_polylepis.1